MLNKFHPCGRLEEEADRATRLAELAEGEADRSEGTQLDMSGSDKAGKLTV